jgi:hypothetical protein
MTGEMLRMLDGSHAAPSGVTARASLVRFDDGLTAVVPVANLEATEPARGG